LKPSQPAMNGKTLFCTSFGDFLGDFYMNYCAFSRKIFFSFYKKKFRSFVKTNKMNIHMEIIYFLNNERRTSRKIQGRETTSYICTV
jgi:hypothetical protein